MFFKKRSEANTAQLDSIYNDLKFYISPFSEGNLIDLLNWLDEFIKGYAYLNLQENYVVKLFPRFLHGTARLRFQGIPSRKTKTWNSIVKQLSKRFRTAIDRYLAEDELNRIIQGRNTVEEYARKIRIIGSIAYGYVDKKSREKLLASHFLRNSNGELKSKLLSLNPIPSTFQEMIKFAEEHVAIDDKSLIHSIETSQQVLRITEMLKKLDITEEVVQIPLIIAAVDLVTECYESSELCYFFKLRKSNFETTERYAKSEVSVNCGGQLLNMGEVGEMDIDLFDAPNELALLVFRGSGLSIESMENWANRKVCTNHINELLLDWDKPSFNHIHRKNRLMKPVPQCSVPDNFEPLHYHKVRPLQNKQHHVLSFHEAKAVLEKKGVFFHPGIPLCVHHKEHLRQLTTLNRFETSCETSDKVQQTNQLSENVEKSSPTTPRIHRNYNSPLEQAVYDLGKLVGVSRIKSRIPFEFMAKRSQLGKANTVRSVVEAVISVVAPGSEHILKEMVFQMKTVPIDENYTKLNKLLTFIAEEFCSANSRFERNLVLSFAAKILPFSQILTYIPGLTFYMYDQARRLKTYLPDTKKRPRTRFDPESVDLFLHFITSNIVMSPFTFGTKKTKTTDGSLLHLPNTIRKHTHAQIVEMFELFVEENGMSRNIQLSESTCYRILKFCSATTLKAATCVDYFLAQALESRDELISLFEMWEDDGEIENGTKTSLQKKLEQIIHYYRSDYRIHVKTESRVADHCCIYALSDPSNSLLQKKCTHKHDQLCEKCEMGKNFFSDVKQILASVTNRLTALSQQEDEEAKANLHKYRQHEQKILRCWNHIESFKKHVLRSSFTDNERCQIVNELEDNEALVTFDFAQKLLVQKHYETQQSYFGKRGMSYHITFVSAKVEGALVTHTFVHILRGDLQDTMAVTAIIKHSLIELKKMGIKSVTLRSDNAGAYHCNQTLSSLSSISKETGVRITRYSFSEPQNGKSSCDRMASAVKQKVRTYVNSGNNVDTVEDFMNVLQKHPIKATSAFLASVVRPIVGKKSEIKQISVVHNLVMNKKGIIARRYAGIGDGMQIPEKNLIANSSTLDIEKSTILRASEELSSKDRKALINCEVTQFWNCYQSKDFDRNGRLSKKQEKRTEEESDEKMNEFYIPCPQSGCIKEFRSYVTLDKHLLFGKHKFRPETMSLRDSVIYRYEALVNESKANFLPEAVDDIAKNIMNPATDDYSIAEQGWALQTRKTAKRFSEKQKKFLQNLFESGEKQKAKYDGVRAEKLMQTILNELGDPMFQPDEMLDFAQINSYFSRLAAQKKIVKQPRAVKKQDRNQPCSSTQIDLSDEEIERIVEEEFNEEDNDELSPEYALVGFKDAKFPDLFSAAEDIVRENMEDIFDEPKSVTGKKPRSHR